MSHPPPLPQIHRDGTRTWRTRDMELLLAWLRSTLADLEKRAGEIVPRACADRFTRAQGGGRVADDGSRPGPTPSAVMRGETRDPVAEAMVRFAGGLVSARFAVVEMVTAAEALLALDPEEARELLEMAGRGGRMAGHCVNCNRWVAGTAEDRLRAWRCDACYRYRARHGGEERPRHLWDHGGEESDDDGEVGAPSK